MEQLTSIVTFFRSYYGDYREGWLTIWNRQNKLTRWFAMGEYELAAAECKSLSVDHDVYFGVGLRRTKLSHYHRGAAEDVVMLPSSFVDLDYLGGIHKENNLPTREQVTALLESFPLLASFLVNSGGGYQPHWLLEVPWSIHQPNDRIGAEEFLIRMHDAWSRAYTAHGWKLDNVSDLARVMRVPGTLNHKDPSAPRPVTLLTDLSQPIRRYSLKDLVDAIREFEQRFPSTRSYVSVTKVKNSRPTSLDYMYDAEKMLERCAFLRHCVEDAVDLPEPHWFCAANVLAFADNGREVFHEISKPYPKYNPDEANAKIDWALGNNGIGKPMTCEVIQEKCGDEYCLGCPLYGKGKSPVSLGKVSGPEEVSIPEAQHIVETALKKAVEERSPAPIMDDEVVGALAVLRRNAVEWPLVKAKIQKLPSAVKVGIRDLEQAIKQRDSRRRHLRLVEQQSSKPLLDDVLSNIPTAGLVAPAGWLVNDKGIWAVVDDEVPVPVCSSPVILTRRLHQVGTDSEKVEIAFYRDHRWKRVIVERSTIASHTSIVQLADRGLPVTSTNAKHLVKYLAAFETANMDVLPVANSVDRMGWVGTENFLPGVPGDVVTDFSVEHGYVEKGCLAQWIQFARFYRQYPIARFALSASFAAPLLRVIGGRVFLIHMYGGSKAGKTAALHLALSVWGDPERLIANFNATRVGLERQAIFNNDLPVGIDERQIVGDRQEFVDSVVYLLGGGKGKLRGNKQGGLQRTGTWKNIVITTGEEPLSGDHSREGIKTRAVEIYGKPIPDEDTAAQVYDMVSKYHGTAGPEFVRRVIELRTSGVLQETYEQIKSDLSISSGSNISSHLSSVAVVCTADYYVSQWLFSEEADSAYNQALELGEHILHLLETAQEADEATRAMEYFQSWFAAHRMAFEIGHLHEDCGLLSDTEICVYSDKFNSAMRERGFNPERIKRDWADRAWIRTVTKGGQRRLTVPIHIPTLQGHVQCVVVKREVVLGKKQLTKLEEDRLRYREERTEPPTWPIT